MDERDYIALNKEQIERINIQADFEKMLIGTQIEILRKAANDEKYSAISVNLNYVLNLLENKLNVGDLALYINEDTKTLTEGQYYRVLGADGETFRIRNDKGRIVDIKQKKKGWI